MTLIWKTFLYSFQFFRLKGWLHQTIVQQMEKIKGLTLPNIMSDDEQEADQASPPPSIAEDSISQSELSPIAPAFSPSISVSSELSNESTENRYQRPSRARHQPVMLNYDRFGSPSNVQHASVQPLQVMSNLPMLNVPAFCPWYYSPLMQNHLYSGRLTVGY